MSNPISYNVSFRAPILIGVRNLLSRGIWQKPRAPVCSKVFPRGIVFNNESDLFFTSPSFDLGFACNSVFHPLETLIPNQLRDFVFTRERAGPPGLVAQDSRHQPSCHSD